MVTWNTFQCLLSDASLSPFEGEKKVQHGKVHLEKMDWIMISVRCIMNGWDLFLCIYFFFCLDIYVLIKDHDHK